MPEGLHGPERCPVAPAGCEACSGFHHWLDACCHEDGCGCDDCAAGEHPVRAWDREHGTDHALAFFACKHCPAWAECDYVWALEEAAGDDDDEGTAWLCWCGQYQEDEFHCDNCGNEPPWGCACCEDADDGEGDEDGGEYDYENVP